MSATKHAGRGRVLVLTSTLPRFHGDAEPRFVLDLAKSLQERFEVTILAPADPSAALEQHLEGVHIVRYRYAPLRSMETLAYPGAILSRLKSNPLRWLLVPCLMAGQYLAAARLLRQHRHDCIHSHWLLPQGLVAWLLRMRFGVPYVVTAHGSDVYALSSGLASVLKRMVMRRAARITVVSTALREHLRADPRLAPYAANVDVIPMGVDISGFHPDKRDPQWLSTLGVRAPIVLFVGRLTESKGLLFLLQALASEPLRSTPATLLIVGDGPVRARLEEAVGQLGIGARVRFLGALNHAELPRVYASADVFCLPSFAARSGEREGLPTVLCEAAASGLPVVASALGGIPEIVQDGVTGVLVTERDVAALSGALAQLVRNEQRRSELGAAARAKVTAFDWERIGVRFGDVLASAQTAMNRGSARAAV